MYVAMPTKDNNMAAIGKQKDFRKEQNISRPGTKLSSQPRKRKNTNHSSIYLAHCSTCLRNGKCVAKINCVPKHLLGIPNFLGWKALPEVILVKIYRFLNDKERVCMSGVCRRWGLAIYSAELWRVRTVVPSVKGFQFASRFGRYVRDLCLSFDHPWDAPECQQTMTTLQESQLRSLEIRYVGYIRHWPQRNREVFSTLVSFLQSQKGLQQLRWKDSLLNVMEGLMVLAYLPCSLSVLWLDNLFCYRITAPQRQRLWTSLYGLSALVDLHIDYGSLSEEEFYLLASAKQGKQLQRLGLYVYGYVSILGQVYLPATWRKITCTNPGLKVSVIFKAIYRIDFARILPREIPLISLVLPRPAHHHLRYVVTSFPQLEDLELDGYINESYSTELMLLVSNCKKLKRLEIKVGVEAAGWLEHILTLQINNQIHLEKLAVTFRTVRTEGFVTSLMHQFLPRLQPIMDIAIVQQSL